LQHSGSASELEGLALEAHGSDFRPFGSDNRNDTRMTHSTFEAITLQGKT
jgi:hypothetical protein